MIEAEKCKICGEETRLLKQGVCIGCQDNRVKNNGAVVISPIVLAKDTGIPEDELFIIYTQDIADAEERYTKAICEARQAEKDKKRYEWQREELTIGKGFELIKHNAEMRGIE